MCGGPGYSGAGIEFFSQPQAQQQMAPGTPWPLIQSTPKNGPEVVAQVLKEAEWYNKRLQAMQQIDHMRLVADIKDIPKWVLEAEKQIENDERVQISLIGIPGHEDGIYEVAPVVAQEIKSRVEAFFGETGNEDFFYCQEEDC